MCNRNKPLLGQLPQCGEVGPHIQFTANQHNLGIGAELLSLPLPLFGERKQSYGGVEGGTWCTVLHARRPSFLTAPRNQHCFALSCVRKEVEMVGWD